MNKKLEDYPKLESLVNDGYDFDFSTYMSKGFDLFKQDIGGFVGYTLLFMAIMGLTNFIPFASFVLSPPLTVGWAIVCYNIIKKQHNEFGEFFKGFEDFGQLILVALVTLLIVLTALIPVGIVSFISMDIFAVGGPDFGDASGFMIAILVLGILIPAIYIGIAWSWAPYFVVFYKMQFWDAMEASRKIITKNWWQVFAFVFVTGLMAALGILGFFIGMLFTLPIMYCMHYTAFAEITALHQDLDQDGYRNIEDHLVS